MVCFCPLPPSLFCQKVQFKLFFFFACDLVQQHHFPGELRSFSPDEYLWMSFLYRIFLCLFSLSVSCDVCVQYLVCHRGCCHITLSLRQQSRLQSFNDCLVHLASSNLIGWPNTTSESKDRQDFISLPGNKVFIKSACCINFVKNESQELPMLLKDTKYRLRHLEAY